MQPVEARVARHYTADRLLDTIRTALKASGADPAAPSREELEPVDEFHTGGSGATDDLLDQLDIPAGTRVLDIGSGLGGPARHVAARTGCRVQGVDLTPAYVETARALSTLARFDDRTDFAVGSAVDLPFDDASFDLALMFHVGMNIQDKEALFAEVARVLAPGGTFALFDVMKTSDAPLTFPFPWAGESGVSFVDPPERYRAAAAAAGFAPVAERERRQYTLDFFARAFARMEQSGGPPPLGIHILLGDTARQKIENYVSHVQAGDLAPFEMIFRAPGQGARQQGKDRTWPI